MNVNLAVCQLMQHVLSNEPLMNDILIKDDGSEVQISKCPTGHGKIKSPMC